MNLSLKNKIVIVTGGAGLPGSIGRTIVRHLAKEEAIPVIVDKRSRGQDLAESIKNNGLDAHFIQADLRNDQGCQTAIEKTIENFGRIDGLVNNMGINDQVSLEHTYDDFIDSLKLNLAHYFAMTKYTTPYLKESEGPIVNIASKVAVTGQGGTSGYAASKGGVLALTREWAVDLGSNGIRVNAVVIAESWTPAYKKWIQKFDDPETERANIAQNIPLGNRMTKPDEIADTTLFLLSRRSSHTTGQVVHVDGGYVHLDRAIS